MPDDLNEWQAREARRKTDMSAGSFFGFAIALILVAAFCCFMVMTESRIGG